MNREEFLQEIINTLFIFSDEKSEEVFKILEELSKSSLVVSTNVTNSAYFLLIFLTKLGKLSSEDQQIILEILKK